MFVGVHGYACVVLVELMELTSVFEIVSSFIYYVCKIIRKTNISYIVPTCAYQWVRTFSLSINFVYLMNDLYLVGSEENVLILLLLQVSST